MRDYEKCPTVGMIESKFAIKINNNNLNEFLKLMKELKQQQFVFWVSNYKQRLFVWATSFLGVKHMLELNEQLFLVCSKEIPKKIRGILQNFITENKVDKDDVFCMAARVYITIKDLNTAKEMFNSFKNQDGQIILEDDAETFRLDGKLFSAYEYVAQNEYDALDIAICVENYENDFFNKIKPFERIEKNDSFNMIDAKIKNREKL